MYPKNWKYLQTNSRRCHHGAEDKSELVRVKIKHAKLFLCPLKNAQIANVPLEGPSLLALN